MTGIVHCGSGNIGSVYHALEYLGEECQIIENANQMQNCDRLVLPGVGAFSEAMKGLHESKILLELNQQVKVLKKPTLGICLGMQIMLSKGEEGGEAAGLGWFRGIVKRLINKCSQERIPHVGWNQIQTKTPHPILSGIPKDVDFYFVHSYGVCIERQDDEIAHCDYANGFAAIIANENLVATQFHPEKSQEAGLKLIENFLNWNGN